MSTRSGAVLFKAEVPNTRVLALGVDFSCLLILGAGPTWNRILGVLIIYVWPGGH